LGQRLDDPLKLCKDLGWKESLSVVDRLTIGIGSRTSKQVVQVLMQIE